jgi:pimeloyl-ACP methyl ester carboxylesterase
VIQLASKRHASYVVSQSCRAPKHAFVREAVIQVQAKTSSASTPEETQFMQTAGLRVRYRVRGDGPPLLMIHGLGAPLEFWRPLEARLGRFQTITVDPPGSGHSSLPRGRFGLREYAGVMDDLLKHLRIDSAGVLGLSLGGMIAQELARRSPRRVEKLVLASTTCGLGGMPVPLRAWTAIANPARFYSQAHQRKIAPLLYGERIVGDPALLDEHIEIRRHCRPSMRGHFRQLRASSTWTSRPWLRHLQMPVLVITGSDDRLVPVINGRIIAKAVAHGRLEIIDGGSHVCVLQDTARVAQLIGDFFDEN